MTESNGQPSPEATPSATMDPAAAAPSLGPIPRVSIGLAVYNGERFLSESIESILAQTYRDFELIISDNASTDRTEDICREFAARDGRIRYSRNPTNIGGVNNENLTFHLSRGEFFRLAAHDDVCAPTLLQKCVEALEDHPDIVLAHSVTVSIDENGTEFDTRYPLEGTASTPHQRLRQLAHRFYPCEATYGLTRSDALRRTTLQKNYTGSDRVLLCELAVEAPFFMIPEPLFFKRFHPGNRYRDWRGRMAWFFPDLANTGKPTFPNWLQLFDFVSLVRRAKLSARERALCALEVGRFTLFTTRGLAWDLVSAAMWMFHSREWRREQYRDESKWL